MDEVDKTRQTTEREFRPRSSKNGILDKVITLDVSVGQLLGLQFPEDDTKTVDVSLGSVIFSPQDLRSSPSGGSDAVVLRDLALQFGLAHFLRVTKVHEFDRDVCGVDARHQQVGALQVPVQDVVVVQVFDTPCRVERHCNHQVPFQLLGMILFVCLSNPKGRGDEEDESQFSCCDPFFFFS